MPANPKPAQNIGLPVVRLGLRLRGHARVALTDICPDERFPGAVQPLKDAVACCRRLGATIQRRITDNGSAFRCRTLAALCRELGIKHRFARLCLPATNPWQGRALQPADLARMGLRPHLTKLPDTVPMP